MRIMKKHNRTRSRGEGAIYFHKPSGLYCAELIVEHLDGTKQRYVKYGKSKEKAVAKLEQLKIEHATGKLAPPSKMLVSELMERWLEDVARPKIRAKTYQLYKWLIDCFIKDRIGTILVQKLSPAHIQNLLASMEKYGKSPRLRQLVLIRLHQALNMGVRYGWVRQNACHVVEKPKCTKRPMQVLKPEQVSKFLAEAKKERLSALYLLALTTGMRFGELLALHWKDLSLDAAKISVNYTLQDIAKHKLERREPKTEASRRSIRLTRTALVALREHKERQKLMLAERDRISPWVFCSKSGSPLRQSNVRRTFKKLLERAELPYMRFHDLRHSFATLMLDGGEHPKIVQEMMGHTKISTTPDTYSHVLEGMQEEAVSRLDQRLNALPSTRSKPQKAHCGRSDFSLSLKKTTQKEEA